MKPDRVELEQALRAFPDPHNLRDMFAREAVSMFEIDDSGRVKLGFKTGYPAAQLKTSLSVDLEQRLLACTGVSSVEIAIDDSVEGCPGSGNVAALQQVKNIVAIASGKGGVGKSATAVNLALGLQAEGATVGLLDADIYGPSQPSMLGIPASQRPEVREEKYFLPIEAHGLQTMSMGYLVTEKTPMVWRGPMVSGALTQMINQTAWRNLDYLIIDMPPGTGDIQLTLSQQVPVSASIVVTTPQDIALLDVRKGIEMFRKVDIPCLGIIENMAIHRCSECGHEEHIFGQGGAQSMASEYGVPVLGSLPLDLAISQSVDRGVPIVVGQERSAVAQQYRHIAREMAARLSDYVREGVGAAPQIVVSDD